MLRLWTSNGKSDNEEEPQHEKKIDVFDYSEQIMKALRKGILLNTNGDKFNSMVISWGHFGIIWGKPTFARTGG